MSSVYRNTTPCLTAMVLTVNTLSSYLLSFSLCLMRQKCYRKQIKVKGSTTKSLDTHRTGDTPKR